MEIEEGNKAPLGKLNYLLMVAGVLIIVVGFVLMSGGGSADPENLMRRSFSNSTRLPLPQLL